MTKTDIFSGFLGAGKTTLIRKLIAEAYKGEKIVLIENEFGEIAIDGGFLKDAGVQITEMNSGCICCTLVGDFRKALKKVVEDYSPDRIIIEPSGVGKLSDVSRAVEDVEEIEIGAKVTVVDAGKCKMYMRNFGEFFNDQVSNADLIVLSRTDCANEEKIVAATEMLRTLNDHCGLITTPWSQVSGEQILAAMKENRLQKELENLVHEHHEDEHHHHHDEDEHEHHHHHHHHHDEDEDEHEHHHHEDEDEHHHHHYDEHGVCSCGHHHDEDEDEHEHHHDEDEDEHEHHHHHYDEHGVCSCGHHHDEDEHGHHHHHHHADEIFTSWGMETARKYSEEEIAAILDELEKEETYGVVLRAKGYVEGKTGQWIYFDYVPGEKNIRNGGADVTGRFCVIGSHICEHALKELFNIE